MHKKGCLEDYQKIAISKGGKCISKEYLTSKKKLKFQCKEGHIWEAQPMGIKKGSWCRICFNKYQAGQHFKLKDGLIQAQKNAELRGGNVCQLNL